MDTSAETLKSKKLKVTPQRLAIYNVLINTKAHPSAEMVHNALMELYPTMSLATVYKTLACLKNAGLVRELSVGGERFRYDADVCAHAHFICTACNAVYDIDGSGADIEELREKVKSDKNFYPEFEQINFYGKCGKCVSGR